MTPSRAAMMRLAPGVYVDGLEVLHIDAGELLEAAGYEDTEANRDLLVNVARGKFGAAGVEVVVDD